MKKFFATLMAASMLVVALSGCGNSSSGNATAETEKKAPPDLTGEWIEVDSAPDEAYHAATIEGDTIEIYWVMESEETKSLYWAGTFTAPTTADEPYTWESENDHSKTDSALLASGDDTKTFTYEKDQISYEASAMGTTMTIHLEKNPADE